MKRRIFAALLLGLLGAIALGATHFIALLQRVQRAQLERALPQVEYLQGPRGRIYRAIGGQGPTMVLLHGFGDQAGGWSQVAGPLSERWRVVAIDLAGHGLSEPSTPPLAMADLMTSVEIATKDLGDDLTFVGNSLGGWVSLRFALEHPERVKQLLLVNSAGMPHKVDKAVLLPWTRERVLERNQAVFGEHTPPNPGFVADQLITLAKDPRLEDLWTNLGSEPRIDGALPKLRTPTALIWGTPDPILPESYAEELRAALDAPEPTWLSGCGHGPQYSCPDRLVQAIEALAL